MSIIGIRVLEAFPFNVVDSNNNIWLRLLIDIRNYINVPGIRWTN